MAIQVNERPLVTFALLAYNQEKFIREAVEGAFAQSYSPLEIIVSDDCSPDRTFEILQEMVKTYRGPHTIVLNRNPKNLGTGGNVNALMAKAKGEWIVVAAGDDISEPNRVEVLATHWVDHSKFIGSLYSAALIINASGKVLFIDGEPPPDFKTLEEAVWHDCCGIHGATHAWHRDVFWTFGPFKDNLIAEDRAFGLRSLTIGQVHYIEEPLVRYRTHDKNSHSVWDERPAASVPREEIREENIRRLNMQLNWQNQFYADLTKLLSCETLKWTEAQVIEAMKAVTLKTKLLETSLKFETATQLQQIRLAWICLCSEETGFSRSCLYMLRAVCPPLVAWNRKRHRAAELRKKMSKIQKYSQEAVQVAS